MDAPVAQAIAIASAGILSPGSILIALLLLSADDGRRKALAYALGYFATYFSIGTAAILVTGQLASSDGPALPSWPYIAIGLLLLGLAIRKWTTATPDTPALPGLFAKIDEMSGIKLLGLGTLVACLNIKNLSLFLSAIGPLIEAKLPIIAAVQAIVVVVFVFCLSVFGPIALVVIGGRHATSVLARLKRELTRHSHVITLVILIVLCIAMLARGVYGTFLAPARSSSRATAHFDISVMIESSTLAA